MEDTRAKGPILVVLHQETSTPGRVGQRLVKRGHALDIRRPPLGEQLPETLEGYDGAVVFGGPMSANDPDEYVKRETDWLSVPLKEDKPFIGICLGAQMLVNHLGGSVYAHEKGDVEIGWYDLEATQAGKELWIGQTRSTNFTERASRCPKVRSIWRNPRPIPIKPSDMATMPGPCSSTPS